MKEYVLGRGDGGLRDAPWSWVILAFHGLRFGCAMSESLSEMRKIHRSTDGPERELNQSESKSEGSSKELEMLLDFFRCFGLHALFSFAGSPDCRSR